jgi:hypothetical protein
VFQRKFGEMHLVLSRRADDLHTLFDVRIRNEVLLGHDEMAVDVSARVESLRIRSGETAQAYAARVEGFLRSETALEPYRLRLDALANHVAEALRATLVGAEVKVDEAEITLIRPGAAQIARFSDLPFGRDVDRPHYRPAPTAHRDGAYADPFFYYYYDPYYDFMSYLMLSSLVHHAAWHPAHLSVIDTHGHPVATGASLDGAADGWVGRDAVSFGEDGRPVVADHVSAAADSGPSWSTAGGGGDVSAVEHDGGGWGGGDDGGGGYADSGGGSSCGSSCGGSSCGSSCGGGGCGGGGD